MTKEQKGVQVQKSIQNEKCVQGTKSVKDQTSFEVEKGIEGQESNEDQKRGVKDIKVDEIEAIGAQTLPIQVVSKPFCSSRRLPLDTEMILLGF